MEALSQKVSITEDECLGKGIDFEQAVQDILNQGYVQTNKYQHSAVGWIVEFECPTKEEKQEQVISVRVAKQLIDVRHQLITRGMSEQRATIIEKHLVLMFSDLAQLSDPELQFPFDADVIADVLRQTAQQ